jgi:flagellar hook-associated protein 3 FlgL
MAINSMSSSATLLGQSVANIKSQLNTLQVQLATGEKSTTYSGMGVGEGFAIAARSQLANITGYQNTITNVSTTISAANTALESIDSIDSQIQSAATEGTQTVNSNGQTTAQTSAVSELSSMLGILNTQGDNGYIFSGNATNTPAVASVSDILDGNGTQAGLTQVISEREQADVGGASDPGRLLVSSPTTSSATSTVSVGEDVAGSPFGMKLNSVSSTLTGATVTGPTGSPASISIDLGSTNPSPGDQVNFTFNLPDGTTTSIQLTATSTSPPPTGSFTIGATSADTAANLSTALSSSISTVANTTLVAASAIAATSDFFGSAGAATGSVENSQAAVPVTGATQLSGAAGTDSLASGFAPGDTLTVNGQTITFSSTAATSTNADGGVINLTTGTVQNVLTAIDQITGTSVGSTASNGVITLNDNAGSLSITSSDPATLTALGFSGAVNSSSGSATGSAVNSQAPAVIDSATQLSGAAGTNSLGTSFNAGDTITVNGQTIQFYNSSTSPPTTAGSSASTTYVDLATATVGSLLGTIDSISGTSTPSTVSGGVVTLQSNNGAPLTVTSSNSAALAALGFAGGTATSTTPPLRVSGSPLSSATSLVNGTSDTVSWYTGGTTTGSARATQVAQIGPSQTVDYGIQANEEGIRSQLEAVAVFAAFTTSASNPNAQAQVAALSTSVGTALSSSPPGQQTIQDIQSDLANAQTTISTATSLQSQSQTALQDIVSQVETVSSDQVATQMLTLQTELQASYETTSTLAQLSLVKYLPIPSS